MGREGGSVQRQSIRNDGENVQLHSHPLLRRHFGYSASQFGKSMNPQLPAFAPITARAVAQELGVAWEPWMQDWPIEVADASRVEEFFTRFEAETRPEHRLPVLSLVVASLNDVFASGIPSDRLLARMAPAIREYPQLIAYWSCSGAQSDDEVFAITPWIRSIQENAEPAAGGNAG
jgi:hypothetical protein